jgi:hypothetical protein
VNDVKKLIIPHPSAYGESIKTLFEQHKTNLKVIEIQDVKTTTVCMDYLHNFREIYIGRAPSMYTFKDNDINTIIKNNIMTLEILYVECLPIRKNIQDYFMDALKHCRRIRYISLGGVHLQVTGRMLIRRQKRIKQMALYMLCVREFHKRHRLAQLNKHVVYAIINKLWDIWPCGITPQKNKRVKV